MRSAQLRFILYMNCCYNYVLTNLDTFLLLRSIALSGNLPFKSRMIQIKIAFLPLESILPVYPHFTPSIKGGQQRAGQWQFPLNRGFERDIHGFFRGLLRFLRRRVDRVLGRRCDLPTRGDRHRNRRIRGRRCGRRGFGRRSGSNYGRRYRLIINRNISSVKSFVK